jgi:hypothetical protein
VRRHGASCSCKIRCRAASAAGAAARAAQAESVASLQRSAALAGEAEARAAAALATAQQCEAKVRNHMHPRTLGVRASMGDDAAVRGRGAELSETLTPKMPDPSVCVNGSTLSCIDVVWPEG